MQVLRWTGKNRRVSALIFLIFTFIWCFTSPFLTCSPIQRPDWAVAFDTSSFECVPDILLLVYWVGYTEADPESTIHERFDPDHNLNCWMTLHKEYQTEKSYTWPTLITRSDVGYSDKCDVLPKWCFLLLSVLVLFCLLGWQNSWRIPLQWAQDDPSGDGSRSLTQKSFQRTNVIDSSKSHEG